MCMSWSDIAGWFLFPQVPCALQYYDVVTKQFITYIQFDLSENCETKLELPEVKGHLIGDLVVAKIWRVLIKYNQIFCPGHEWVISFSHSLMYRMCILYLMQSQDHEDKHESLSFWGKSGFTLFVIFFYSELYYFCVVWYDLCYKKYSNKAERPWDFFMLFFV